MNSAEAKALGYTVDTTCYPWVAYKGPRFDPTDWRRIPTDSEADLEALRTKYDTLIATYKADLLAWKTSSDALYTKHQELRTKYDNDTQVDEMAIAGLRHELENLRTKYEELRTTAETALEALRNVPCVGEVYDQQHSDTQIAADLALEQALKGQA